MSRRIRGQMTGRVFQPMIRGLALLGLLVGGAAQAVPTAAPRPEAPPDLRGIWASRQVTTAEVELPVLGRFDSTTTAITLMKVSQRGGRLHIDERVCALDTDAPGPVETVYSRGFLRAVSQKKSADVRIEDGRVLYEEAERGRVLGAKLTTEGDALPTSEDDPRVTDPDDDGHPGLSIEIKGIVSGRIHIAQRYVSRLVGELVTPRRLTGRVEWSSEQSILGATTVALRSGPKSRTHPDPDKSYFEMRRVPATATCRQVIKRQTRLFGGD